MSLSALSKAVGRRNGTNSTRAPLLVELPEIPVIVDIVAYGFLAGGFGWGRDPSGNAFDKV